MQQRHAKLRAHARIGDALRLGVEAAGHRRHLRLLEGDFRRRRHSEKLRGVCDDVFGRRGIVVADIVDRARAGLRDRRLQDLRDVVHMDPAEDLPRLHDPARRAAPDLLERPPSGAVDSRQPEYVQRKAGHGSPLALRLRAHPAAPRRGRQRRRLVHPSSLMVAVDPGGREIAHPRELSGETGEIVFHESEDRIAALARSRRHQHMGGRLERAAQIAAGPQHAFHAVGLELWEVLGAARRAADRPAPGQQPAGEGLGGIAVAE